MSHEPTKLVLGRGEVYFDRFVDGTKVGEGERYLGNTTTFRIQRSVRLQERSASYHGKKIARAPIVISEEHVVDFITDNIDFETISMWFGSSPLVPSISMTTISETLTIKCGRFYQLGRSQHLSGTRNIRNVSVYKNGILILPDRNYRVDESLGRIEVFQFARDLRDGNTLTITFDLLPSDTEILKSDAAEVYGALRFVAFNEGPLLSRQQNDYFFPFVRISSRGQTDMKGDEWQQWGFEATALNLTPLTPQVQVTRAASKFITNYDESVIVRDFGSLETFLVMEDQLHQSVNYGWPPSLDLGDI